MYDVEEAGSEAISAPLRYNVKPVRVAPPSEEGADQRTSTEETVIVPAVGAAGWAGVVRGTTSGEMSENEPVPAAFTAATRNTYKVPFDKPVTVAEVSEDVPSAKGDQDKPSLAENCTT